MNLTSYKFNCNFFIEIFNWYKFNVSATVLSHKVSHFRFRNCATIVDVHNGKVSFEFGWTWACEELSTELHCLLFFKFTRAIRVEFRPTSIYILRPLVLDFLNIGAGYITACESALKRWVSTIRQKFHDYAVSVIRLNRDWFLYKSVTSINSEILGAIDIDSNLFSVFAVWILEDHAATLVSEHHFIWDIACECLWFLLSALDHHFSVAETAWLPGHRHAVARAAESLIAAHYKDFRATGRNFLKIFSILTHEMHSCQSNGQLFVWYMCAIVLTQNTAVETNIHSRVVDSVEFITVLWVVFSVMCATSLVLWFLRTCFKCFGKNFLTQGCVVFNFHFLSGKDSNQDVVETIIVIDATVPRYVYNQCVLARLNDRLFDHKGVEEVWHSFLAGATYDIVWFINQNHREGAWCKFICSIFGAVLH